jgi:hypothetical protein
MFRGNYFLLVGNGRKKVSKEKLIGKKFYIIFEKKIIGR